MKSVVEVENLSKRFGSLVAVNGINFQIQPSEIFGLLGPNGAGKTTTLRILSTVLGPTSGTARVAGYDVSTQALMVRQSIGVLPEDAGLYDRLTAREHLQYFAKLHEIPKPTAEKRIDQLLEFADLLERADEQVGKFSKGMRQKVALIKAFVHDPPVLLLDEPTAGLDVSSARAIREYITGLKQQAKTILLSTHNMTEAQKLCDRIAIIHRGRIVGMGTIPELRTITAQKDLEEIFVQLTRE